MRPRTRCGTVLLCLVAAGRLARRPWAFAAPSAAGCGVPTKRPQQPLKPVSITGVSERNVRAAPQMALPPRIMGGSSARRPRPRQRTTNYGAGFTSLVMELTANPRVMIGEIAVIVILSGVFERLEHKARHALTRRGRETGLEFLNAFFKEITTLGFVAFVIFIFTHTGTADRLSPKILEYGSIYSPGHNPLAATFETVHMMIFMLLVVLLAQASTMFFVSESIMKRWGDFERTVTYGSNEASMESQFVEAGYLRREPDPSSPGKVRLVAIKSFEFGSQAFFYNLFSRGHLLHRLIMWRALRHDFLFPAGEHTMDGEPVRRVPDPGLFSLEEYLRPSMAKVVLSLIHIDRWTWMATLGLLSGPLYIVKVWPWIPNEAINCIMAWFLALVGVVFAVILEKDTLRLTPTVPKEAPKILQLFSGESLHMLRRCKMPGWQNRPALETITEDGETAKLGAPRATKSFFSTSTYKLAFRILSFFQAVSVTSLILSHLSAPVTGKWETIFYCLAWAEWPFMLLIVVPVIIRRLTVRSCIVSAKDMTLMRKVTTQSKESLLRDYARLVQLIGFERRVSLATKGSSSVDDPATARKNSIQMVLRGLQKFDGLPPAEQREIALTFAAWDGLGTGVLETRELVEAFKSMGVAKPQESVDHLIRVTDFDSCGTLNWMKFKALLGLAVADVSVEDKRDDLMQSFSLIDKDNNDLLSIFELADGFHRMHIGVGLEDMANLLFVHFGIAKPTITRKEFVEWIVAISKID